MKKREAVVLTGICSFALGFFLGGKMLVGMINDYKMRMKRNNANMMIFHDWLEFLYNDGRIDKYFHDNAYRKVIIYGNGYVGKRLRQALEKTDIEVAAIMDKKNSSEEGDIVIGVDDAIPDVDCIIITPVLYYDEIYNMMQEKTGVPIISIEEVWRAK